MGLRKQADRAWNVLDTSFRERPTDVLWPLLGPRGFQHLLHHVRRERYRHFAIGTLDAEALARLFGVTGAAVRGLAEESIDIRRTVAMRWPEEAGNLGHLKGAVALYVLCRLAQPSRVVETGVASGISTSFILEAMVRNSGGWLEPSRGRVVSVDVKNAEQIHIPAARETGWMIPASVRDSWELVVGDSRNVLIDVLARTRPLDMFLHDSLHTPEHQRWEYELGWEALRPDGFLLSDNVETGAFSAFCREKNVPAIVVHRVWRGPQLGITRKPH
jgi:predicted O-methyltransferase YrrM